MRFITVSSLNKMINFPIVLINAERMDVVVTGSMPDIAHMGREQHFLPAPGSEVTLKQYEVEEVQEVDSEDEKVPVV